MKLEQYILLQAIYEEFKDKIKPEDVCRVEIAEEGKYRFLVYDKMPELKCKIEVQK